MWSKKHKCCVECKTTTQPHEGRGLCKRCYMKPYLRRYVAERQEQVAAYKRDWYLANRDLTEQKQLREQKHFDGRRELVLQRDGYKCVRCGSDDKLTVHHKDRQGRGSAKPNNKLANLETVCRACHIREHRAELRNSYSLKYATPKLNKAGRWSRNHDCCVECGQVDSKHVAKGLCNRCNVRRYIKHKMT